MAALGLDAVPIEGFDAAILDEPDLTARALDQDGWYYSGDLCRMDDAGFIANNRFAKPCHRVNEWQHERRDISSAETGC